jgi:hypothetical protein
MSTITTRYERPRHQSARQPDRSLVRGDHRYDQIHCSFCRWRPFGDSVSAVNFGSR